MAQIEALFEFLIHQGGYELFIPSDDNCQLTDATGTHPLNQVMSAREVAALIHEILPVSQRDAWSTGQRVELVQRTGAGEFRVTAEQSEAASWIRVVRTPRNYIEHLAAMARAAGAGELLLAEGAPAFQRREGVTERLGDAPAMPDGMLAAFLRQEAASLSEGGSPRRFLTSLSGAGRARVTPLWGEAGPAAVFRLLPEDVSLPDDLPASFRELLHRRSGLVLVAAQPGAGLTTLLTALLRTVVAGRVAHVVSIEDLVEIPITPESALLTRCVLGAGGRRDEAFLAAMALMPEVLFVHEIADAATLRACLDAARAGILVIAGCHGATVQTALDRLLALAGPEARAEVQERLGDALLGAVAQTLCRGSDGKRVAVREVLVAMPATSDAIRAGRLEEVADGIDAVGFSLHDALVRLVVEEKVSLAEAEGYATDRRRLREEVSQRLKRAPGPIGAGPKTRA